MRKELESVVAIATLVLIFGSAGQSLAADSSGTCKGGWPGEAGIPLIVTVEGQQPDGAEWRSVVKIPIEEIRAMAKLELVTDVFDLEFELDESAAQRLHQLAATVLTSGIKDTSLHIDVCDEAFSVGYRPLLETRKTTMRVAGEGSTWGVTAARADELVAGVGF